MFFPGKEKKDRLIEQTLLKNYNSYYRLAYSYVHNDADAADIVQNGAYHAIRKSSTLKENCYAATWIYRIMLNEIFRYLKKEGQTVSLDNIETEPFQEDNYENIDLQKALDSLSPQDKAVIELKYFEELKFDQIAEILDENVNTIKSRLYRGLKKLKLELSDEILF